MTHNTLFPIALLLTFAPAVASALPLGAEIGTLEQYRHGKFEARTQFAAGDGIVSTFFLWKDRSEMDEVFWLEIDVEKIGASCSGYSSNALFGLPQRNHVEKLVTDPDLCTGYHTHTVEWTPEAIIWSLDGVELRRITGEDVAAFNDNGPDGMQMRFNLWVGDPTFGGTLDPATLPVHQYVSYAEFSTYTPGAGDNGTDYTLQWRDSFETGVDGEWLKGSWDSPLGNSTHSPQNVTAQNGIAVLSLTPEESPGFTGTAPADPLDLPSFKDGMNAMPVPTATAAPADPPSRPTEPEAEMALAENMRGTDESAEGGCSMAAQRSASMGPWWFLLGLALLGKRLRARASHWTASRAITAQWKPTSSAHSAENRGT